MDRDRFDLAARLCLSAVFLYSGFDKLMHWNTGLAEVTGLDLPWPTLALALTIAVQISGGLMVLLGLAARLGAFMLAGFTIVATLIAHDFWNFNGGDRGRQLTIALEHLAIVGGFVLIVVHGSGALSLDRILRAPGPAAGNRPVR
jgi:uncharacterized membrane protein YphA (DoxX/SURF4 family)